MPQIVQFTHPGAEHGHDKGDPAHKSWNEGSHRRKFLKCAGKFVERNSLKSGELLFWGEWEPPSIVSKLDQDGDPLLPKWLHEPYMPIPVHSPTGKARNYQNTDPFVFGKEFKYFICKQIKQWKPTKLASLERGSIILFGSTKGKYELDASFQLDTVFVISDYIDYDPSSPIALSSRRVPQEYKKAVYDMVFGNIKVRSVRLRLYFGATYEKPFNGMYSYVPSMKNDNSNVGFPRVQLRDIEYLRNNLNSAPKSTSVDIDQSVSFWREIREVSRKQGCVEGVEFNYRKK